MTSLQKQLAAIAASSTHQLDLKAQKTAHAKSLLFEPKVAVSQSFDVIYQICHEGFLDLCALDGRFVPFSSTLFSAQGMSEDRSQMTKKENQELDSVLESFLTLVGPLLLLKPAVKSLEWLLRRFRVHEYNTECLILTFLPYHTTPFFPTLLSVLPANISPTYRFLAPYISSVANPPRQSIIYTAVNTPAFFSAFQQYILKTLKSGHYSSIFISFWASMTTQAIDSMLESANSGRKEIQQQREEELILRILPVLNECLRFSSISEAILGCYMIITVLATKATFQDKVLDALMEAVLSSHSSETLNGCLACLAVIAEERTAVGFTNSVTKRIMKVENLPQRLISLDRECRVQRLALGCTLGAMERIDTPSDFMNIQLIEQILTSGLLDDLQISLTLESLLQAIVRLNNRSDYRLGTADQLGDLVVNLKKVPSISQKLAMVARTYSIDIEDLEARLGTDFGSPGALNDVDMNEEAMEIDEPMQPMTQSRDMQTFTSLPAVNTLSFLETTKSTFEEIAQQFVQTIISKRNVAEFLDTPDLGRTNALNKPLFLSFLMRIWCSPYPTVVRNVALRSATKVIRESNGPVDLQALIPYLLFVLSDTSLAIRRSAAECIVTLAGTLKGNQEYSNIAPWGSAALYGAKSSHISWLSTAEAFKVFSSVLIPILEECILDSNHMVHAIRELLDGSSQSRRQSAHTTSTDLKSSHRNSFISFLSKHAILTPILGVRLRLILIISALGKAGSIARTSILLPAIRQWCSLSEADAAASCNAERLSTKESDKQHLAVIVPRETEGINLLREIIRGNINQERWAIQEMAFERIKAIWPSLKSEGRLPLATALIDIALDEDTNEDRFRQSRRICSTDTLHSIKLSSPILESFIDGIPNAIRLPEKAPAAKRRRTSRSEMARIEVQSPEDTAKVFRRMTLVLELVEVSNPGEHLSLLRGLFNILGDLQQFKQQSGSSLVYLQSLVLGSLLPIVDKLRETNELTVDKSAIRADLLVECIRHTSNPQVQNTALLLISSLASWSPELVLHNLMPVFTFMGSTLLRQNDDYSAHVVDQTISRVVPQLATSLRRRNKDFLTGISDLLLSFTAAFEHIPPHRRLNLFSHLCTTLGPEDALPAILALLIDRYPSMTEQQKFVSELLSKFNALVALQTLRSYLDLVADALNPKRAISDVLLSFNEKPLGQVGLSIVNLLASLASLINDQKLRHRISKALRQEDEAIKLRSLFVETVEKTVQIMQRTAGHTQQHDACSHILTNCLNLLPTPDLIKSAEMLLGIPNDYVRRAAMKSVEIKVVSVQYNDAAAISALLAFLTTIESILASSKDTNLRLIAVSSVDQITERFGKKDPLAVMSVARAISGMLSAEVGDDRLCVMSLLCLASIVDVVQDEFISLLPDVLPKAFQYLDQCIVLEETNQNLHNAVYAFLCVIIQHLPFVFSGEYLEEALALSHRTAAAQLAQDCVQSRGQFNSAVARHIDAKETFSSVKKTWPVAIQYGYRALNEQLEMLNLVIENRPKPGVSKSTQILFSLFLTVFDLRNTVSQGANGINFKDVEIDRLEKKMFEAVISMTLKLNDATFRPFLVRLIEWASESSLKQSKNGKTHRATTLFLFLSDFFERFKSIVTSYSSYIVEYGAQLLENVSVADEEGQRLCGAVLRAFRTSFQHDQDGFWQAPAHFGVIMPPLSKQLTLSSPLDVHEEVIPTVTELAASTSSADNLRGLNAVLLKHMRAEEVSIRLAAVKCQQSLTKRLGEDWLGLLAEMLPIISELREDDDEVVERETNRWITMMEEILGESLDPMLQ